MFQHRQSVPYALQWAALSPVMSFLRACTFPKNCPFAWGTEFPSNMCFLGPTRVHNTNGISIGSGGFAQLTSECRRACRCMPSPASQFPFPTGRSGPPSNTWFLESTRANNPNRIFNSAQLGVPCTIHPSYIRVRAVVWTCGGGQTHRQTHRRA